MGNAYSKAAQNPVFTKDKSLGTRGFAWLNIGYIDKLFIFFFTTSATTTIK